MNAIQEFKDHVNKTIKVFESQLHGIDSNVTGSLIEVMKVLYEGQKVELRRIALVYEEKGRVCITPFDRSYVGRIAKELQEAGFNAYTFSREQAVVNIPPRSGEQTQEIVYHIKRLGENAKIAIRNARKKCKQKLGKDAEKEIQAVTDKAIGVVDAIIEGKRKAITR